jgi:hypothetical protein
MNKGVLKIKFIILIYLLLTKKVIARLAEKRGEVLGCKLPYRDLR